MTSGTGKPVSPAAAAPATDGSLFPYAQSVGESTRLQRIPDALQERYAFQREIGRGGAAYVFLAEDRPTGHLVAVKVLRSEVAASLSDFRFQREIDIARTLQHPNILPVLDSGSADGQMYLTMPYVAGGTLRARLRREQHLKTGDALAIARAVANALGHAHERGIIHRDVKPANILLDETRIVLTDFGIARAVTLAPGAQRTESGVSVGTPEYMSPEHGTGARDLDARTDVYSLGCVVYEMLAGEPPFTGPSAQAIIARHCHEAPRSIRVIRPAVPLGVERAVEKALAKVPADRFSSPLEFAEALERGEGEHRPSFLGALSARTRALLGAGLAAAVGLAAWLTLRPAELALDANRIVVFPLRDASAPNAADAAGEGVATFIGYALEGTRPLKWLDGWELLNTAQRASTARLEPNDERRLSSRAGAGFYIDGSILRQPDFVAILLTVVSVNGDSVVRRAQASAPSASASLPQLGLRAVAELLPTLIAPGGKIDLSMLSERRPTAVANFLQGEREYRRMQFRTALAHYESSVQEDSSFALAALRGAQAANWLSEFGRDVQLAEVARRHIQTLSPAQAHLTRGLHAYVTGAADSAIFYLQRALSSDSTLHAAWALLGEVSSRLLPTHDRFDSLSRYALERARRTDNDFAPTLLLLEEVALRDGDVSTALRLREELRQAGADTTHATSRGLMLRCVRDGPGSIDWPAAVQRDENSVLVAAKTLSGRAAQSDCSIAAFRTLLNSAASTPNARWAALIGLQSLLVARNRSHEVTSVFASKGVSGLPVHQVYVLLAAAGAGFVPQASAIADTGAMSYRTRSSMTLWQLGSFEARVKNVGRVRQIAAILRHRADSTKSRRDVLLSNAVRGQLRLLDGDTLGAVRALRALVPTAPRGEIAWQPWESLGPERLLLAELLFARGQFAEARATAELLDATEPITYPLYLRRSLELRALSADRMNDSRAASQYRRRLAQLSSSSAS